MVENDSISPVKSSASYSGPTNVINHHHHHHNIDISSPSHHHQRSSRTRIHNANEENERDEERITIEHQQRQEPNLFSPRSTAAMALSSISQLYSTTSTAIATATTATATATTRRSGSFNNNNNEVASASSSSSSTSSRVRLNTNTTSTSKMPIINHTNDKTMNVDTSSINRTSNKIYPEQEQQLQLPPPQSLFTNHTAPISSHHCDHNNNSINDTHDENVQFIPNLPQPSHDAYYPQKHDYRHTSSSSSASLSTGNVHQPPTQNHEYQHQQYHQHQQSYYHHPSLYPTPSPSQQQHQASVDGSTVVTGSNYHGHNPGQYHHYQHHQQYHLYQYPNNDDAYTSCIQRKSSFPSQLSMNNNTEPIPYTTSSPAQQQQQQQQMMTNMNVNNNNNLAPVDSSTTYSNSHTEHNQSQQQSSYVDHHHQEQQQYQPPPPTPYNTFQQQQQEPPQLQNSNEFNTTAITNDHNTWTTPAASMKTEALNMTSLTTSSTKAKPNDWATPHNTNSAAQYHHNENHHNQNTQNHIQQLLPPKINRLYNNEPSSSTSNDDNYDENGVPTAATTTATPSNKNNEMYHPVQANNNNNMYGNKCGSDSTKNGTTTTVVGNTGRSRVVYHQNHPQNYHAQQQQNTPYYYDNNNYNQIDRCNSYNSTGSSNTTSGHPRNTNHHYHHPIPHETVINNSRMQSQSQQQQQQQVLVPPLQQPPPPPTPCVSYNRTVSWNNNEPMQWIQYNSNGPPMHYMPMMHQHPPPPPPPNYYPPQPHMIHGGPNHTIVQNYVTPTPHKKQKILLSDNHVNDHVTPNHVQSSSSSSMMSKHVFCPPRPPLTKNKKPYPTTTVTTPTSDTLYTSIMINPSLSVQHQQQHCPSSNMSVHNHNMSNITQNDNDHHQKYNRKNKSLGVLAESFLKHFTSISKNNKRKSKVDNTTIVGQEQDDICQEIMIDKLSVELAVERRRIYDVVNILEALQVIVKMGKNTYHWMGREHLTRQFALLQNEAIESWPEYAAKAGFAPNQSSNTTPTTSMSSLSHPNDPSNDEDPITKKHKKAVALIDHIEGPNKSLTRLSQLFLQVFLIGAEPLSLPQASDLIHGGRSSHDELVALGMKPGDAYPTNEKHLQQVAARGLKTKIRRLYDIANVFLSVGLLRKSENRTAPTTDGKRPLYCLNYHLSIHEIRSIYKGLPAHMLKSKSPFSDEQWSKFNRTAPFRVPIKYFGLSEPTTNVLTDNCNINQQDQHTSELPNYTNNVAVSSCQVNAATTSALPTHHDQSTDEKHEIESPMATTSSVATPTSTTPSSSTTSMSMMNLQEDTIVSTTLSPPDSSTADSVDSKESKMIDRRSSLLNNIHIVGGAGTTTDDDHYHQHQQDDDRNTNVSNRQANQMVIVPEVVPTTTSPLSSTASPTTTTTSTNNTLTNRMVLTTSPSITTTTATSPSSSFVVTQLSPRRVSMEK